LSYDQGLTDEVSEDRDDIYMVLAIEDCPLEWVFIVFGKIE